MIIGVILVISTPNHLGHHIRDKFWYIFGFRVLMGIGIGGDYPMSASIVAERSSLRNRGRMLGWIFSNQGWVRQPNQRTGPARLTCTGNPGRLYRDPHSTWLLQQSVEGRPIRPARCCLEASNRSGHCTSTCDALVSPEDAREQEVPAVKRTQHIQSLPDRRLILDCRKYGKSAHREDSRP